MEERDYCAATKRESKCQCCGSVSAGASGQHACKREQLPTVKRPYGSPVLRILATTLTMIGAAASTARAGDFSDLLHYLNPALKSVGGAARIYYAAGCEPDRKSREGVSIGFPAVNLQPPGAATGLAAIHLIFQNNPQVAIIQDRSGVVMITIGNVSTAILQTKISVLNLDLLDQYNADGAINAIESGPEVYAAEQRLKVHPPFGIVSILESFPPKKAVPHLPAVISNVTVDEALNSVVRTFKGIVIYGICTAPNGEGLFDLDYVEGT